ncbi:carotenoid ester lipase precursor [Fomes fomentarius]|nr:carotenoid ester lipase precursor [Fomes fomentarius]
MLLNTFLLSTLLQFGLVYGAATLPRQNAPSVKLDKASVLGTTTGTVESFLGIPFAKPPVGDLRLRLPQLLTSYSGAVNATTLGNQCVQQALTFPSGVPDELLADVMPFVSAFGGNPNVAQSEDCLYINVVRPANTPANAKLPVIAWIYGGAFAFGSNAVYDGVPIVQRSIDIGEPVIYVAMNYRLHVLGFLGGKEVKKAGVGNLGLQDQRAGLRWVNKFISSFGGDPSKVTIWGESAGAISVSLQLLANGGNTEGLFRAGIMNSGGPPPTGDITEVQDTYDFVVKEVGCSTATDTLACLRTVSVDKLLAAANQTPTVISFAGLNTPYMPRADGTLISTPPQQLALQGNLASVPFIIGDVKDEGTLFSLGSMNITTDDQFSQYVSQNWFPGSTVSDLSNLLSLYPSSPAAGSPFDTGSDNAFTPEYKRIAALQGDWIFQGPRRLLLDRYSVRGNAYSFLSERGDFPGVGDGHGSDLFIAYGPGDMTEYFVRFANDLNPSPKSGVQWPKYDSLARQSLSFQDGNPALAVVGDADRLNGIQEVLALSLRFPF